jgi:hypothetical protein
VLNLDGTACRTGWALLRPFRKVRVCVGHHGTTELCGFRTSGRLRPGSLSFPIICWPSGGLPQDGHLPETGIDPETFLLLCLKLGAGLGTGIPHSVCWASHRSLESTQLHWLSSAQAFDMHADISNITLLYTLCSDLQGYCKVLTLRRTLFTQKLAPLLPTQKHKWRKRARQSRGS